MNTIMQKILILIIIVLLIVALVFIVVKGTKKKDTKKEETKITENKKEEKPVDNPNPPVNKGARKVKCTYEGQEPNVIWEKSYVLFDIDDNNKVITREDSRDYKFERVNIDEYINNKTLDIISRVLNGINGISSSLVAINEKEHTYRFTTTFDFREINQDDLYNFYYKRFYNNGDLFMSREDFDERYKSLDYDAMVEAYIGTGYTCS